MPVNVDALVKEGMAALKAGRKDDAHKALMKAVEIDEQNEDAWLWLSAVVDTPQERQICLENVLSINPANVRAQKGLEATIKEIGNAPPAPASRPAAPDPFSSAFDTPAAFSGTGFESAPYTGSTDPMPGGWDDPASSSSSVDWGRPADDHQPSSGVRSAALPSEEEYDTWMAGLSLGSSGSTGSSVPAFQVNDFDPSSGPFGSSGFDDNAASDPYGSYMPAPFTTSSAASSDPFGGYSYDEPAPASDPYGNNPFGNDPFGAGSQSASAPFGNDAATFDTEDQFDAPPAAPVASSPFTFSNKEAPALAMQKKALGTFDESAYDAMSAAEPLVPIAAPQSTRPVPNSPGGGAFTTLDSVPNMKSPALGFQSIPEEIQVADVAGKPNMILVGSLVVLGVLNVVSLLILLGNLGR